MLVWMTTTSSAAPGALERVRGFLNTVDVENGTDEFADAASARSWLREHGGGTEASDDALDRVVRLREALREAAAANHDGVELPAEAASTLTDSASWSGLGVAFGSVGWSWTTSEPGVRALVGELVGTVASAIEDGTWTRLKLCRNSECEWAFYDSSRARSRSWCDMGLCGNRAKQARWRERQGSGAR